MGLPADYDWYLGTEYWQQLRDRKLVEAGFQCERCGMFARRGLDGRWTLLQIHHKTYERMPWRELPADLEVLCAGCHSEHHGHPNDATAGERLLRLSQRVAAKSCGWVPEDVEVEVEAWDNLAREAGC